MPICGVGGDDHESVWGIWLDTSPAGCQHIETQTKRPPCCNRHFKCIFVDGNLRVFFFQIPLYVPMGSIINNSILVQIMTGTEQAANHYLIQWGPSLLVHLNVTRLQWANSLIWLIPHPHTHTLSPTLTPHTHTPPPPPPTTPHPQWCIYASVNWVNFGSDNGIGTKPSSEPTLTSLTIEPLGTKFSEFCSIKIFSLTKLHLKVAATLSQPQCAQS